MCYFELFCTCLTLPGSLLNLFCMSTSAASCFKSFIQILPCLKTWKMMVCLSPPAGSSLACTCVHLLSFTLPPRSWAQIECTVRLSGLHLYGIGSFHVMILFLLWLTLMSGAWYATKLHAYNNCNSETILGSSSKQHKLFDPVELRSPKALLSSNSSRCSAYSPGWVLRLSCARKKTRSVISQFWGSCPYIHSIVQDYLIDTVIMVVITSPFWVITEHMFSMPCYI